MPLVAGGGFWASLLTPACHLLDWSSTSAWHTSTGAVFRVGIGGSGGTVDLELLQQRHRRRLERLRQRQRYPVCRLPAAARGDARILSAVRGIPGRVLVLVLVLVVKIRFAFGSAT